MKTNKLKNITLILLLLFNILLLYNNLYRTKTKQQPIINAYYASPLNMLLEHKQIHPTILHKVSSETVNLLDIPNDSPKLVIYIQNSVCRPCLIEFIRTFEDILSLNIINKQQVCVISNFVDFKDFKAFAKSSFDEIPKYNGIDLLNDQGFIPTGLIMFILVVRS